MEFKPLIGLTYEYFFQILNTIVLFFALKHFLFKPVLKIVDERKERIDNDIEFGKKEKSEGIAFKKEYEERIQNARSEGHAIVDAAKKRADIRTEEMVIQAKNETEKIKEKMYADIEKEKKRAVNDIKDEISDIALMAASKVIEKDIDKQKHEELINNFVKELGDDKC